MLTIVDVWDCYLCINLGMYQNLENNKWNLGQYFIYIWYTYNLIYNVK
jgi:hypothetical protein